MVQTWRVHAAMIDDVFMQRLSVSLLLDRAGVPKDSEERPRVSECTIGGSKLISAVIDHEPAWHAVDRWMLFYLQTDHGQFVLFV